MDPITININLNLPEKQAEWICSAIACLAQIVDQASRTAGTPFPPAQVNMTQHGANSTQIAQVANVTKGDTFDAEIARDADKPGFVPPGSDADETPEPQHTHDDVRNLVITLTQAGYKKEAAAIVRKYAPKVTEVPESSLDALYAALEQLGGNDVTDA